MPKTRKPAFLTPVGGAAKKPRRNYLNAKGDKLPGVTTILGVIAKPQLIRWANKLGLEGKDSTTYVDALAAIGTLAHAMVETHLKGGQVNQAAFPDATPEQFDKATNSFLKYLAWEKQHEVVLVASELELISEAYQFGAGIDAVLKVDGVSQIVDFKTSKAIYDDHFFQVAAYASVAVEHGYTIDGIRILQIGRSQDEGFSEAFKSVPEIGPYWEVFDAARKLYLAKKAIGGGL